MSTVIVKKRNLRNVLKNENKNVVKTPKIFVDELGNVFNSYESILENLKVLFPSISTSELKSELEKNKNDVVLIMETLQQKINLRNNLETFNKLSVKLDKENECEKQVFENNSNEDTVKVKNDALREETVNIIPKCNNLKEVDFLISQFEKKICENIENKKKDQIQKLKAENFILKKAVYYQKKNLDKKIEENINYEQDNRRLKQINYLLALKLKEYEKNHFDLENPNNIF